MARKTITYEEIRKLSPTELGKMSKSQLADLVRRVRVKNQTRLEQLEKASSVYSPAGEKMRAFYESKGEKSPSKMTRNQMLGELFASQSFHSAQTSTVAGSRKVAREQDIRIFGAKPSGALKARMTREQRSKFWAIYDEFTRTYKNMEYLYGSNRIQQVLGEMIKGNKTKTLGSLNVEDFDMLLNNLAKSQEEEQGDYEFDDANVYSGRWTD